MSDSQFIVAYIHDALSPLRRQTTGPYRFDTYSCGDGGCVNDVLKRRDYDAVVLHDLWPDYLDGAFQGVRQIPLVIITVIGDNPKLRYAEVLRGYDPSKVRFLSSPVSHFDVSETLCELLE